MSSLLGKLYRAQLLSPSGLYHLLQSLLHSGSNLFALLQYAGRRYPDRTAVTDDTGSYTFARLNKESLLLAELLHRRYAVTTGKKIAVICKNHAGFVTTLFAAAATGADVYLLPTEMGKLQLEQVCAQHAFDLVLTDPEFKDTISGIATNVFVPGLARNSRLPEIVNFTIKKGGRLVVLTGGTTADSRIASRTPSLFQYLQPFLALMQKTAFSRASSVLITLPMYHGFGLAAMIMSVLLGVQVILSTRKDNTHLLHLINQYQVSVIVLVPLVLQRMLQVTKAPLPFVQCIISGGDTLPQNVTVQALQQFGPKLYNLYGTSEAGLITIAGPADLKQYPATIGRAIKGAQIAIWDKNNEPVANNGTGRLVVKNSWSANTGNWIETGDFVYKNDAGYLFLKGRIDEMIVSGGENVYPVDVEHTLRQHPAVKEAIVKAIADPDFGQRLQATVVCHEYDTLSEADLRQWLLLRIARYQMPSVITFATSLTYTGIGKVNKK